MFYLNDPNTPLPILYVTGAAELIYGVYLLIFVGIVKFLFNDITILLIEKNNDINIIKFIILF